MKYLIVTADDLGLARSINEGIARAFREGIVTDISAIPTGEAFEDACKVIKDLGLEGIGAHLALTETKPLLKSSRFYKNHNQFFLSIFLKRVSFDGIYKELKSQIELLKNTGVRITHLNSHEHIHMIPEVFGIFACLAKEYGVPSIRYPSGDRKPNPLSVKDMVKKVLLKHFSGKTAGILNESGVFRTEFFLGLLDAGRLNEDVLLRMLKGLKGGVTELVCHPGFLSPEVLDHYPWHIGAEAELFALTSGRVKNAIKNNGIRLTTYGELPSIKR